MKIFTKIILSISTLFLLILPVHAKYTDLPGTLKSLEIPSKKYYYIYIIYTKDDLYEKRHNTKN